MTTSRGRTPGHRWHIAAAVTAVAALCSGTAAASAGPDTAADRARAGGFCTLTGMTTFTWTGDGDGTHWSDGDNWAGQQAPDKNDRDTGYVCLDAPSGVVTIVAGEQANIQAFDVAPGTTLRADQGGKIFVYGDPASRPSVVRSGAQLEVISTYFGGPGRVDLLGDMTWQALPTGGSTILSDPCSVYTTDTPSCAGPGTGPGRLVVGDDAVLAIDRRGVALADRYVLEVHGRVLVTNEGYIAANHGTGIELLPRAAGGVGTLELANDGGVYEGSDEGLPDLATFLNEGLVHKSGGVGTSAVIGQYSGGGAIRVDSGKLTLPEGSSSSASVARAGRYGSGTCPPTVPKYGCVSDTTVADTQFAEFTVPKSQPAGTRARVVVRELTSTSSPADIAFPVLAHATSLKATKKRPAIITLRYDASVLGGKHWNQVTIRRQAKVGDPYVLIKGCRANGQPARGQVACVDRRGLATSSRDVANSDGGAPDVIMVVRTTRTSRWCAR